MLLPAASLQKQITNSLGLHSKLCLSFHPGYLSLTVRFRFLAPVHGIDYLTPSIVALAARKVFRHRIIVANPEDDRSLQYGSELGAVSHVLMDVTPDSILDGVLALEPPI